MNLHLDKYVKDRLHRDHVLACFLYFVGHAFVEKRKKVALREYKKLLKKTREEHRQLQSSEHKDRPLLTTSSRVSDDATSSIKQVCI